MWRSCFKVFQSIILFIGIDFENKKKKGIEKAFNGLKDVGKKDYFSQNFFSHRVILWQPETPRTVLKKGEYVSSKN